MCPLRCARGDSPDIPSPFNNASPVNTPSTLKHKLDSGCLVARGRPDSLDWVHFQHEGYLLERGRGVRTGSGGGRHSPPSHPFLAVPFAAGTTASETGAGACMGCGFVCVWMDATLGLWQCSHDSPCGRFGVPLPSPHAPLYLEQDDLRARTACTACTAVPLSDAPYRIPLPPVPTAAPSLPVAEWYP